MGEEKTPVLEKKKKRKKTKKEKKKGDRQSLVLEDCILIGGNRAHTPAATITI